jgi:predicted enzyme related to lactoylglutathione lyase
MEAASETGNGLIVWHDHVSVDRDAAIAFYSETLGWEIERWDQGETIYPMLGRGGSWHGGFVEHDGPGYWLPYVRVEDVRASVTSVAQAGGTVIRPPTEVPNVGMSATVADPGGAEFALWQDAGGPLPARDVFAWEEVYVPEVDDASDFYGKVFGWAPEPFQEGYTVLANGELTVCGILALPEGLSPTWLTYLAAEDVDATFDAMLERGAERRMGPVDIENVGRVAVLRDPLGAAVGLYAAA